MPFEQSLRAADLLLGRLERAANVSAADPDDPWAHSSHSVSAHSAANSGIRRERCADCAYVMTRPFERRCPLCAFKAEKVAQMEPQFVLPPIEEVLAVLEQARLQTQSRKEPAQKKQKQQQQQQKQGKQEQPKPKQQGGKKGGAAGGQQAGPVADVEKCQLRVGKITDVKEHPAADKLYVCQVDVGEEKPRTVCAGLRNFFQKDELHDRLVVVITNLKAAKMVGVSSEAMVLAADFGEPQSVKTLVPPTGAAVGDVVSVAGGPVPSTWPKTLSSTIWKRVVEDLKVNGHQACYQGKPLVVGEKGPVAVPDAPAGAGIH